jgi:hypothetical protein
MPCLFHARRSRAENDQEEVLRAITKIMQRILIVFSSPLVQMKFSRDFLIACIVS